MWNPQSPESKQQKAVFRQQSSSYHPGSLYLSLPPTPPSFSLPHWFGVFFPRWIALLTFTIILLEWGSGNYDWTAYLTARESLLLGNGCEWPGSCSSHIAKVSPGRLLINQSLVCFLFAVTEFTSTSTPFQNYSTSYIYAYAFCFGHILQLAQWGRAVSSLRINWPIPCGLSFDGPFSSCVGPAAWMMSE